MLIKMATSGLDSRVILIRLIEIGLQWRHQNDLNKVFQHLKIFRVKCKFL